MQSIFEIYNELVKAFLLNAFFIFLVLAILSIFKKDLLSDKFLKIFAYILIFIGILNFISFLINFESYKERLFGPYGVFLFTMLFFHSLFPLILFIEKFRIKIISFLIVLFLMQMGRFFEIIVILTTSLHRDYL